MLPIMLRSSGCDCARFGQDTAPACPGLTLGPQLVPCSFRSLTPLSPPPGHSHTGNAGKDLASASVQSQQATLVPTLFSGRLKAATDFAMKWLPSTNTNCCVTALQGEPVLIRGESKLLWKCHAEFPWLYLLKDDCSGRRESYSLKFTLINQKYLKYNLPNLQ